MFNVDLNSIEMDLCSRYSRALRIILPDIYDEDRLSCGAAAGLRHNVCLAAVTFLAVLLTVLYTIHYWLKRCIPKVSDAFFIYTDAAENVSVFLGNYGL